MFRFIALLFMGLFCVENVMFAEESSQSLRNKKTVQDLSDNYSPQIFLRHKQNLQLIFHSANILQLLGATMRRAK